MLYKLQKLQYEIAQMFHETFVSLQRFVKRMQKNKFIVF